MLSAVIIIYEKNIIISAEKIGIEPKEQMASTMGHEVEHLSKENVQQKAENEYTGTKHDTEAKPRQVGKEIIDEYKARRPILPADHSTPGRIFPLDLK